MIFHYYHGNMDVRQHGIRRLVLETPATWHDAILLYQRHGFTMTHEQDGDGCFVLDLMDMS